MRANSYLLDSILGERISVLDDGFVRVVDYMGNDSSIVQAARVSYGAGTIKKSSDEKLIRHLMRSGHWTPFEMCSIKLHVRIPMDAWRQFIRHRTAKVNEYSTRYSLAIDRNQKTEPAGWRLQSSGNKQGSDGLLPADKGEILSKIEQQAHKYARDVYDHRVELGVAREQARKDLPLSTYTEAYWKMDLRNLFNFLYLRCDSHAQYEIRQYANVMLDIVHKWCPAAYEAFCDYKMNSITFSLPEQKVLYRASNGCYDEKLVREEYNKLSKREKDELLNKIKDIGLNLDFLQKK